MTKPHHIKRQQDDYMDMPLSPKPYSIRLPIPVHAYLTKLSAAEKRNLIVKLVLEDMRKDGIAI